MNDQEWIAAVREYAAKFGCYRFSAAERERMQPFLRDRHAYLLQRSRFMRNFECNLVVTYELMDTMETGIVAAVAAKLTGALTQ